MDLQTVTQLKWRQFLATEAGIEGMLFLRENEPSVTKGQQPHDMIHDGGRIEGYKECLMKITDILAIKQKKDVDPSND